MIPELRRQFLARWTPALYREMLRRLESRVGRPVEFRISETPVFYPEPLLDKMVRYGQELYTQIDTPEYRAASEAVVPAEFKVPNEAANPLFVQADFGLFRAADGSLEPRLVEIQGFPSIYAMQTAIAEVYAETFNIQEPYFLGGLDRAGFVDLLRRAVVADNDTEDVVLLEIDPEQQKTAPDFYETAKMLGIRICPLHEVEKRGSRLYFRNRRIRRIYNRVIADEVMRKNVEFAFRFTDELEVEWAGHPNWFFRLSKFSLPFFHHASVPATKFLHEVDRLPDDLDNYVLKPLFSFAGLGVVVGPSRDQVDSIPGAERPGYILQERMNFVPTLETPSGLTNIETRIMYIHDGGILRPVTTVVRTGRGKMMGVDFNKNLDWVGASAGFYPTGS